MMHFTKQFDEHQSGSSWYAKYNKVQLLREYKFIDFFFISTLRF